MFKLYEEELLPFSCWVMAMLPAKSTTVSFIFWFDGKPSICKLFVAGLGEIVIAFSIFDCALVTIFFEEDLV